MTHTRASPFQPIETDESAKKPDQQKLALSSEEEREAITQLEGAIAARHVSPGQFPVPSSPGAVAEEQQLLHASAKKKNYDIYIYKFFFWGGGNSL